MKISTTLILIVCAGTGAFVLGRASNHSVKTESGRLPDGRQPRSIRSGTFTLSGDLLEKAMPKPEADCEAITPEDAMRLTSEQRMALLKNGATIYHGGNQTAVLTGLISALTKEEIQQAADYMGGIQDRGNYQTQEVWDALWQQWGRVDPAGCLQHFGTKAVSKSPADARNVMTGWLETDARAAIAWAKQPKESFLEKSAAALALATDVNGNPGKIAETVRALKSDPGMANATLTDFYDLVSMADASQDAATIYSGLDPELKELAWGVTYNRLSMSGPEVAAAWLNEHINDPGHRQLIPDDDIIYEDPDQPRPDNAGD